MKRSTVACRTAAIAAGLGLTCLAISGSGQAETEQLVSVIIRSVPARPVHVLSEDGSPIRHGSSGAIALPVGHYTAVVLTGESRCLIPFSTGGYSQARVVIRQASHCLPGGHISSIGHVPSRVFIDGAELGGTPLRRVPLSAGSHLVQFRSQTGTLEFSARVDVRTGSMGLVGSTPIGISPFY